MKPQFHAAALAVGMGVLGGVGGRAAEASTFTPDMWVYEVDITVAPSRVFVAARTSAPAGTPLPTGCTQSGGPSPTGDIYLECTGEAAELGIDVTTAPGLKWMTGTVQVGFNDTIFRCTSSGFGSGPTVATCPAAYKDAMVDYASGSASYSFSSGYSYETLISGGYGFDGSVATFSGYQVASAVGDWDYGYGGDWYVIEDAVFNLTGGGRLISAPKSQPLSVPLPAPALLLLSGLGALFVGRVRRRS